MNFLTAVDPTSTITTQVTAFLGWMGDVADTIAGSPMLLIPISIFVVGGSTAVKKFIEGPPLTKSFFIGRH